jgi:Ni/Co efflux regulator RcnB
MRMPALLAAVILSSVVATSARAQETAPASDAYAWDAACKECHADIHDAWAKTKHARTINRLTGADRQAGSACIGCHVTGPKDPLEVEGTMVNANVQCEACHGAGKAHIEAAKAGNAASVRLAKKPAAAVCETCHNDKSPHYRGFYYSALAGLVHKK